MAGGAGVECAILQSGEYYGGGGAGYRSGRTIGGGIGGGGDVQAGVQHPGEDGRGGGGAGGAAGGKGIVIIAWASVLDRNIRTSSDFSVVGSEEMFLDGKDVVVRFTTNGTLTVTGSGYVEFLAIGGGGGGGSLSGNLGVSGGGAGDSPYNVVPRNPVSRVIAIQGNHDTGVDSFYRDCAFTAGNVRFIAFFASYVGLPPPPGKMFHSTAKISDETLAFVEREMARASSNPEIHHVVLVSHWAIAEPGIDFIHPIVGPCKENGWNDNRRCLLELAEKHGCRLFINGHEHNGLYPVGRMGCLSDVNCGTITADPCMTEDNHESGGAFAIVEIFQDRTVFNVYSRASVREEDGRIIVTARPRRLFAREVPM